MQLPPGHKRRSILARPFGLTSLVGLLISVSGSVNQPLQQKPQTGSLEIESFACTRAYAAGMSPITLVGTVRNRGAAQISANTLRLRMHVLAGLDYLSGDTAPWAPALAPGKIATFKWQVQT